MTVQEGELLDACIACFLLSQCDDVYPESMLQLMLICRCSGTRLTDGVARQIDPLLQLLHDCPFLLDISVRDDDVTTEHGHI